VIDIQKERVISLSKAKVQLPVRRAGKKPHLSCLYRWSTTGCRGVVLETIQIGGTRCTSIEAMQRFFERLSRSRSNDGVTVEQTRTESARGRASERAAKELKKMGL